MTTTPPTPAFDWLSRHMYRALQNPWPPGYPPDSATYFSPEDGAGIHRLIVDLLTATEHSAVLNMYGFDDPDANAVLLALTAKPNVYVQMNLDSSQAGGKAEKTLLAEWNSDAIGTSVAIGQSSRHAISHLKVLIVDGLYVVSGSTNWSLGGEEKQDNQLTVTQSAVVAAQYRSKLDIDHTAMLSQMSQRAATSK